MNLTCFDQRLEELCQKRVGQSMSIQQIAAYCDVSPALVAQVEDRAKRKVAQRLMDMGVVKVDLGPAGRPKLDLTDLL